MLKIRQANAEDISFVLNSYYLCARNSSPYSHVPNDVFSTYYNPILISTISKSNTLIACNDSDPDVILGYIVYAHLTEASIPTIHMLYVKKAFRSMGIARALFKEAFTFGAPTLITTYTPAGLQTIQKLCKCPVWYNPFLLD